MWAPQNTRDDIFDALKRRESYATSGPRMAVRFYAAAGIQNASDAQALCDDPSFPQKLLEKGAVPMGGDFKGPGNPYLFVYALKDKDDLESIDIVKISLDVSLAPKVNVQTFALTTGQLAKACVFWQDAGFAASTPTLYYSRILQQPTWRWSHYDCQVAPTAADGGCDPGGGLDVKVQERAWTSPIFSAP